MSFLRLSTTLISQVDLTMNEQEIYGIKRLSDMNNDALIEGMNKYFREGNNPTLTSKELNGIRMFLDSCREKLPKFLEHIKSCQEAVSSVSVTEKLTA